MSNDYKAIVAKLTNLRPIEGKDRIQLATVLGYQLIVGKDAVEGSIGIYFQPNSQISEEYAQVNDIIKRKDGDGNPAGGMFESNRKVRSIKLGGEKSEGYFAPLSSLEYTRYNLSKLKEGDMFDTLNDKEICRKYVVRRNPASLRSHQKPLRRCLPSFPEHVDTDSYKYKSHLINNGDLVTITAKLHGTSHRYGHVAEVIELKHNWFNKLLIKLGASIPKEQVVHNYVHGSRRVVLDDSKPGYYGSNDFRRKLFKDVHLHKGEVLYGELVGWVDENTPIMAPQDTTKLKDKEITKKFGDKMVYTYGCVPGEIAFYVYRICMTNEDGVQVDLSWNDVKRRCNELGLKHVPEIYSNWIVNSPTYQSSCLNSLTSMLSSIVDGISGKEAVPDSIDPTHLREGVVVRVDSIKGTMWLKYKSFWFGVLEGYGDENAIMDMETAEDYIWNT